MFIAYYCATLITSVRFIAYTFANLSTTVNLLLRLLLSSGSCDSQRLTECVTNLRPHLSGVAATTLIAEVLFTLARVSVLACHGVYAVMHVVVMVTDGVMYQYW